MVLFVFVMYEWEIFWEGARVEDTPTEILIKRGVKRCGQCKLDH
jgi:hypothetical protein